MSKVDKQKSYYDKHIAKNNELADKSLMLYNQHNINYEILELERRRREAFLKVEVEKEALGLRKEFISFLMGYFFKFIKYLFVFIVTTQIISAIFYSTGLYFKYELFQGITEAVKYSIDSITDIFKKG